MEIFSKILTSVDINKGLEIPHDRCDDVLAELQITGQRMEILVADMQGNPWNFVCFTKSGNQQLPKPVFKKGWLEFAGHWNLAAGTTITFYKEIDQATGAQYKIRVR
uniref:TF-B3 domain-containing protein n=1 Tax=Manihot esculenta TaxID=3983 RepID=A0A2C9V5L7_MANES